MTRKALALAAIAGGLNAFACNSSPQVHDIGPGGVPAAGMPPAPGSMGTPPPFGLPPAPTGMPPAAPGAGPCVNLQCQQSTCVYGSCNPAVRCPAGQRTSVRGKVFDPAGKVPLYNVLVYVPNGPLDPINVGPSCDRCDTPISGKPIASALSDTAGEFRLDNVPVGTDIPLVVQVGKWRRQVKLPKVEACTETVVDDPNLVRLPRNQTEGNIPRIALTTGGADRLECLLRKIGIEDGEFTPEAGPGRVNFFAASGQGGAATASYDVSLNGGATFTRAISFWDDPEAFKRYDMVILSCEGAQFATEKKQPARDALVAYANMGGRVFASHWHNIWLEGSSWSNVATFINTQDSFDAYTGEVNTSFPKGNALADWLYNVMASPTRGQLMIQAAKRTVMDVNAMFSTPWIRSPATSAPGVQYFTFNTPAGAMAGAECGRVVFTDIHVSAGDRAGPMFPFPKGCVTTELSPQEKALEFILFDLSSCVQPDDKPPVIP
jgi:hypothetical protein